MSCVVIEELAEQILDVCGSESEVCALIDNILCYIRELNIEEDEDIRICDDCGAECEIPENDCDRDLCDECIIKGDIKDDEDLEGECEMEDLEVITDKDGFKSLR